jgi:GntR family transcriptional repressor for pyruvate dehydrogenase complex
MSARSHVAERLEALLVERDLAPGDRLPPERQLAAELGVSRASLREGLRRLLDLGIVEARQGSGTYVADVDLADLLDVRLRLEPHAAGLAARRRSPDDLARMDELLADLRAAEADPDAFAAADALLHAAIVDAAGSPSLRILLAALTDLLRHSRATTAVDAALRATVLVRLERLVRAIHDGDTSAAEHAMRTHLSEIGAPLGAARAPPAPATS